MLSCTEANIEALTRIAEATTTTESLADQNLRDVAALYREISVFVVRLLEAASAAGTLQRDRERHAGTEITLV